MITNSADIYTLDFGVLVDLSTPNPTVVFTNLSTGPNLAGCKFIFNVFTPNNTSVHSSNFAVPDRTGIWTSYTLPEFLPLVLGNLIWSGSAYRFVLSVQDSAGNVFTHTISKEICKPNGNMAGSNFGLAKLEMSARCNEAKLYVEDKTSYSYRKQISPSLVYQKRLTLVYPPTEQGTFPLPFVINDFTNGLIPITESGPGYKVILESIVNYDLGDNVFLKIKYKFSETFPIQCNIDLCSLTCEYSAMVSKAETSCDRELSDKLLLINAKINQALIGKMQPLCKIDVGKLVEEIKVLGDFTCDCEAGTGIVALISSQTGSGSIPDCNAVIACLNGLLNTLDPKCLATPIEWGALGAGGKLQLIINAASSQLCQPCLAPDQLTFDINTKKLRWHSNNNSTVWRVEYRNATAGAVVFILFNTPAPVYLNNGYWEVNMSGVAYQINSQYEFKVSAQCANGTYSTPATSDEFLPESCININDVQGNIS